MFSVGLRLGFLVAPAELIPQFSTTLAKYGVKAATTAQRALSEFMNGGDFYRHIRRVRRIYGERRKIMLSAIQDKLGDIAQVEDHSAGMQLLVSLPDHFDDQAIVDAARGRGVVVNSLSSHYAQGKLHKGLVLGFCGFEDSEIIDSVSTIESIIHSL